MEQSLIQGMQVCKGGHGTFAHLPFSGVGGWTWDVLDRKTRLDFATDTQRPHADVRRGWLAAGQERVATNPWFDHAADSTIILGQAPLAKW